MIRLTSWLAIANGVQLGLTCLQAALLSRWLGVEKWGALGRILAIVTIADVFAQTGIERVLTREVTAQPKRDGALFAAALTARSILAGAAGLVLLLWKGSWAALMMSATVGQYGIAVLNAKMLGGSLLAARLLAGVAGVAAVLVAIALGRPAVTLALGALACAGLVRTLGQLCLARSCLEGPRGFFGSSLARTASLSWNLVRGSWPLWANGIVAVAWARLDVILFGVLVPDAADRMTGYYQCAYPLIEGGNIVLAALAFAAFPVFSSLRRAPTGTLRASFLRAVRYAFLLGGAGTVLTWVAGPSIIWLLFGPAYAPSSSALALMAPILTLNLLNSLLALLLTAVNRIWAVLAVSVALLIFNASLNLVLIPEFGFNGAAAAKTATEFAGLCLFIWRAWRTLYGSRAAGRNLRENL